jgi:hypothetical protein
MCIKSMHSKLGYKCKLELSNAKEARNSPKGEKVRPHALDQSYKETKKISMILATGVSWFSNVHIFLSL